MPGPSALRLYLAKLARLARARLRAVGGPRYRHARLSPAGEPRGRALLSYVIEPFLLPAGAPVSHAHTHDWESLEFGRALLERGLELDVVSWDNDRFEPREGYDWLIDPRYNLERLAGRVGPRCLRLLHADTAHLDFHNAAEAQRLAALHARRGVHLAPRRRVSPCRAIETCDAATVLGNEFTLSTYRFAGKPLFRVPISTPLVYPFPEERDETAARRRFLWFGSGGMVHKGLDLVLEAFATLPDLELAIVGPVENEIDFVAAYRRELYATPNIRLLGWMDIAGPAFRDLALRSAALVYPSCSEGGGGSVLTCMHAGLVPIVTAESSVDIAPSYGRLLAAPSVEAVRDAVTAFAGQAPAAVRAQTRAAWDFARAHHTRETFARDLRRTLERIEHEVRPALASRPGAGTA